MVKLVRVRNVPVQRGRVELREQIDLIEARVNAVRYRNIHQPILARQRHRRLRAL